MNKMSYVRCAVNIAVTSAEIANKKQLGYTLSYIQNKVMSFPVSSYHTTT